MFQSYEYPNIFVRKHIEILLEVSAVLDEEMESTATMVIEEENVVILYYNGCKSVL